MEDITNVIWGQPTSDSHLEKTCHTLVKKQLDRFTIEDLRIMIGQEIGTEYLMPYAIIELRKNILAEGDMYSGDLLSMVLSLDSSFWKEQVEFTSILKDLVTENKQLLFQNDIDYKPFLSLFKR